MVGSLSCHSLIGLFSCLSCFSWFQFFCLVSSVFVFSVFSVTLWLVLVLCLLSSVLCPGLLRHLQNQPGQRHGIFPTEPRDRFLRSALDVGRKRDGHSSGFL